MKKMLLVMGLLVMLIGFGVPVTAQDVVTGTDGMPWWNDRVFYEIFVRSFQDSDGDGIGDLQGLISKLDYLNDGDPTTTTDLGVTGLWLMPIFESPSYHGYDVTDYMTVNPDYGTNDDFKALMQAAHERGIAVIIDMVINHTSREHPWFEDSRTPGSAHDSWYRWSTSKPAGLGPWGEQIWHSAGNRYYYGVFWEGMPDLNLRNPAVTQAVYDVAKFWIQDMGADGFRLDGARYLVEDGGTLSSSEGTLNWLTKYHDYLKSLSPNAFAVGEVWTSSFEVAPYVPASLDVAFEFDLATATLASAQNGRTASVSGVQERTFRLYPAGQYATFLTNHDQNRVMNEVAQLVDKAKVAASMMLTNTGVPFLYYGEEIGMIGTKPDECLRTPMQWTAEVVTEDFMAGKNCQMNPDVANVEAETSDPNSLLSHYRNLIAARNAHPALRVGDMTVLDSDSANVYAFIRHSAEETVLVLINLSDEAVSDYGLSLESSGLSGSFNGETVLGTGDVSTLTLDAQGGFSGYVPMESLAAYSTTVIVLGAAD